MLLNILINLLIILVVIAVVYLVLYLFQKWVMPIDSKIVGIILFVLFALLVIYAVSNHGIWVMK